jgi:p-aminobenzoyl-glutamate transporter AbgT
VGTPKRERQKANRLQRQIEDARAERVGTVKRTALRIAVIAVIAIVAVVVIAWFGGAFSDDESGGGADAPLAAPTVLEVVR